MPVQYALHAEGYCAAICVDIYKVEILEDGTYIAQRTEEVRMRTHVAMAPT